MLLTKKGIAVINLKVLAKVRVNLHEEFDEMDKKGSWDDGCGDDERIPQNDVSFLVDDVKRKNAEVIVRLDGTTRTIFVPVALGNLCKSEK